MGEVVPPIPADHDALLSQAEHLVRTAGFGSRSLLQRKLRLGFQAAENLLIELEARGVVGPARTDGRARDLIA